MNSTATDLEWYLNRVDYRALEQDYVPSSFALEFLTFIKLVNGGEGEENSSPVIHYDMIDQLLKSRQNLYVSFRGSAKALAVDTLLMTPNGFIRMGDVEVGSRLIDRNGKPTTVTVVSDLYFNKTYRIKLTDGSSFIANEDHLHIVQRRTSLGTGVSGQRENKWVEQVLTTKEILNKGVPTPRNKVTAKNPKTRDYRWFIPLINSPVEFESTGSPVDPYTVGVILGGGAIDKVVGVPSISSHIDDVEELKSYIPYEMSEMYHDKRRCITASFSIRGIDTLVKNYIGTNTTWTKFIPRELLFGSVQERIDVLRGLMDTAGTITPKGVSSFTSASQELAQGVVHIVKSLGGNARIKRHENAYAGYCTIQISLPDINPFRLKRKADRWVQGKKYKSGVRVAIDSIEAIQERVASKCVTVDSETASYLIEDSIVTHNTSVIHEYMILYLSVHGRVPGFGVVDVGMYISDTIDNGVKSMRTNLEYRWTNSEFLQTYVPSIRFTDTRWEFTNVEGKKLCIHGFGASTGVRGFKEYGKRPTWAGFDDLMSDKNAESATITRDIKHVIYKAARQALHPSKRMMLWTGTPFNKSDPLYEATTHAAWNVRTYPICEKFPCTEEEFRGAWEDRFSFEFVKAEYRSLLASGEIASFNQELMLRITSEEDRLVQDHDIVWYERKQVLRDRSSYNFYITTDFATSEKSASDFSVIGVWAYTSNQDWLLVDGICARQLMDVNIDELFRFVSMYKPLEVGIEINGQQGGFVRWIKQQMLTRKIFFNLAGSKGVEGIRRTRKKIEYFKTFLPIIKSKKLWLPEEMRESPLVVEMVEELRYVTVDGFKSKHDDVADMTTMLQELDAFAPSEETVMDFIESEDGTFVVSPEDPDKEIYKNSLVF